MSTADPQDVLDYVDKIMKAVGGMRQGDVLGLAFEMATHLAMDDLRQHVQLTPTTVHEQRVDSPAFKALAKALHSVGIDTPGFGTVEQLEEYELFDDDEPIPYTTVFMDDDEDLHFPMQDN